MVNVLTGFACLIVFPFIVLLWIAYGVLCFGFKAKDMVVELYRFMVRWI